MTPTQDQVVDNLLSLYKGAGSPILEQGLGWYQSAKMEALRLSQAYFLASYRHAAGVISVLSPAVKWEVNLRDAETACAARKGEDFKVSTYRQFKQKAIAIRDGDHPKKWINPKTAPKTWAFYQCISNPESKNYVVIDRHALAAAMGRNLTDKERSSVLKRVGAYEWWSGRYKEAAAEVGVLPLQMQAVVWLQWRGV